MENPRRSNGNNGPVLGLAEPSFLYNSGPRPAKSMLTLGGFFTGKEATCFFYSNHIEEELQWQLVHNPLRNCVKELAQV